MISNAVWIDKLLYEMGLLKKLLVNVHICQALTCADPGNSVKKGWGGGGGGGSSDVVINVFHRGLYELHSRT